MLDYSKRNLSMIDFRSISLSGGSVAHSLLDGCRFGDCVGANFACAKGRPFFKGADVTDTTFEKAAQTVLDALPGAFWRGIEITCVSSWLVQDGYWCFCTNAFVQCGCMQKTLGEWQTIGSTPESIRALHDEQPRINLARAYIWWHKNEDTILRWAGE